MIGKITLGKSFKGCILYCLSDKKLQPGKEPVMEGRAEVILFNQCFGNAKELIAQFQAVRQLNPKLSKPVLHITLSLAPGEQLTKDKLMEMSGQCARKMGFDKNQYIAVHHRDTRHQHVHLVANRIGFDGKSVSDSNSYKRIAAYCRKMELQYNLKQVQSPGRFLSHGQRSLPRQDVRKAQIKKHIKESLATSRSFEQFVQLMKEKKCEVIKGRGIAFRDEKNVYVKGSELGYSLQTIERMLEQNKVRLNGSSTLQVHRKENKPFDSRQFSKEQSFQGQDHSLARNLDKELSKAVDLLLRSEKIQEQPPKELTTKIKKRKKKGLHL